MIKPILYFLRRAGVGNRSYSSSRTLPRSFSWLNYGVRTLIRDQGDEDSCAPIAVCGAIEMAYQIHRGRNVLLSERELIDNGVLMSPAMAFNWISRFGVCLGDDYVKGKRGGERIKLHGYFSPPYVNELHLIHFILRQPIVISINHCQEFSSNEWELYKIVGSLVPGFHAMVALGWEINDRNEIYFMVQNCWGYDWGKEGYGWVHHSCIKLVWVPELDPE